MVVPILVSVAQRSQTPDPGTEAAFAARGTGVPSCCSWAASRHKAQHELVQALWLYRRWYDPKARLLLVGPAITGGMPTPSSTWPPSSGWPGAVVHGEHLTSAELAAWYGAADVFVCLSEHEGFCIPLLEAMQFDLPIVAFAAGAVPETVGNGRGPPRGQAAECVVAATIDRVPVPTPGSPVFCWWRSVVADCAISKCDRTRQRFVLVPPRVLDGHELCAPVKLTLVTPRYGVEVIGGVGDGRPECWPNGCACGRTGRSRPHQLLRSII